MATDKTNPPDDFFPELDRTESRTAFRLISELDEFKGRWRRLKEIQAEKLESLRQVATIESAASSTRIEGAELSDEQVAAVLGGLKVDSFRTRDEAEVRGYGELHTLIYESWQEIPLTENHIRQLHALLLRHVEKDERHRGEYKKLTNDVIAKYEDGRTEVIFQTATPFNTPRLMAELVERTNEALADSTLHPLFAIARFVVSFLAIHPFQDGNGRLSRTLTTLLLLKNGYDYAPYSSLERIVEENKVRYYAALRESQLLMRDQPARFGAWLLFFLGALVAQKQALDAKLGVERGMLVLSAIQERLVAAVKESAGGRATAPELSRRLKLADRTVRYHLDLLVRRAQLSAHGEKKGRYYTLATSEAGTREVEMLDGGTNAIVADVLRMGGRIKAKDLAALAKKHGYKPQVAGILHGRRLAHLKRDPRTRESVLTTRGEEIGRQYLFAERLSSRTKPSAADKPADDAEQ
jgi:Fic family protein